MERLLKWLPVIILGAGIVAEGAVSQFQIGAIAEQAKERRRGFGGTGRTR